MLLKAVRERIEELNPFDILTYDLFAECNCSVNREQYYSSYNHNSYFYQHCNDGNIVIGVIDTDDDTITVEIGLYKNGLYEVDIDFRSIVTSVTCSFEHEEMNYKTAVYVSEEDYFQQSTVQDLGFTIEENNMIIDFINKAYELIKLRTVK